MKARLKATLEVVAARLALWHLEQARRILAARGLPGDGNVAGALFRIGLFVKRRDAKRAATRRTA